MYLNLGGGVRVGASTVAVATIVVGHLLRGGTLINLPLPVKSRPRHEEDEDEETRAVLTLREAEKSRRHDALRSVGRREQGGMCRSFVVEGSE